MTLRIDVSPKLLRWACERAGWSVEDASARFPRFAEWIAVDPSHRVGPTLKQLESFARATHTPIGYLFLPEPPVEEVPIPDCRTMRNIEVTRPSADMLEAIYLCQQRQAWYRDHALTHGEKPLTFVGSSKLSDDTAAVAARMREELGFELPERRALRTWEDALRHFVARAEALGVLVMVSGIVGSDTHRALDPGEFRGFALVDDLAPVVFVNGADSKAAQMFTLAHELAHVWIGETALSDVSAQSAPTAEVERWCNAVAAELLVPLAELRDAYRDNEDPVDQVPGLARMFKVSRLVILRRLHDVGVLSRDRMWALYRQEVERLEAVAARRESGGNYYLSQGARLSRRFLEAVYVSTWEGRSSFTEAMRLVSVKKVETFRKLAESIGLIGPDEAAGAD